MKTVIINSQR